MPKNVSRKRKNILPWIVAFLTLILIIISKTAYSAGEQDFRQGMQYYRNRQFSEAFPCFEKAARSGNTEAQSMIGVLYFQGNGVGKDDREAAKWFDTWFKNPIPPKNLNLNFELSDDMKALFKSPNDKALN